MKRACLVALLLALPVLVSAQTSRPASQDWKGHVIRVVDGDTVEVTRPAATGCVTIQKIRVRGVDAPEKAQAYGKAASRFTAAYLFNHDVVVKVKEKDRYGRWVADLCRGVSKYRCISYQLVRQGWAWWYKKYEPDNKLLKKAEERARKAKLGLWAGKNPVEPWIWRQQRRK